MTLLTDVVKVLHDAQVVAYSVHSSVHEIPGDPDLVVTIEDDDDGPAADRLSTAVLPIAQVQRISRGVLHVWQRPPSD